MVSKQLLETDRYGAGVDNAGVRHTPGPWGWFGNEHGFYLAAKHSGRLYVMDFTRRGMNGAQPRFRVGGLMHDAADLVQFAVGKASVRGLKAAKKDQSVYRYDITGIDHPDARLIAAAPDLFEVVRDIVSDCNGVINPGLYDLAATALAKATPQGGEAPTLTTGGTDA